MRRRSSSDSSDSLELLLDPICNMFGTIMFVALIAAILVMAQAESSVDAAVQAAESDTGGRATELEARAAELEAMLASLPAPEAAVEEQEAVERVGRAVGEIARREDILRRYRETIEKARVDFASLASSVEPMREEISRVEEALEAARRAKDRQLRTPLEREVSLFEYTVVVWGDRLYPVCDLSTRPREACEWLRQWHPSYTVPAQCDTPTFRCSRTGILIERRVQLREGAGIALTDAASLRADPAFVALLASLDPAEDLIGFVVAPDSFDAFAVAKEAFLSAGFNYSVQPCEQKFPRYEDSWIPGAPRGL
ncbi:MAG: hypothetical protein ACO3QC_11860 [Phycisphaerales bacterium]